jgi:hypothetical protein
VHASGALFDKTDRIVEKMDQLPIFFGLLGLLRPAMKQLQNFFLFCSGVAVLLVATAGVTEVRFASRRVAVSVGIAAGVFGFGNRG